MYHSSMVREVLLVNWLYHIFQCKLSLNTRNWLKHVTLFNVTCLRKILSKCSSQINFPNMWHWSMSHVWEKYIWISQTCDIEQCHMFGKFIWLLHFDEIFLKHVLTHICTHYWNVNPMTLKMLHWKIHTSSLELKNNPKLGLRPRVGLFQLSWVGMDFSM